MNGLQLRASRVLSKLWLFDTMCLYTSSVYNVWFYDIRLHLHASGRCAMTAYMNLSDRLYRTDGLFCNWDLFELFFTGKADSI